MKVIIRLIPLILFVLLGILLYRGLSLDPQKMPSALEGKQFPAFNLTKLSNEQQTLTNSDVKSGIKLFNVWATWCPGCKYEHPFLVELSTNKRFTLYGVNYQDDRAAANLWLQQYKDPYAWSVFDDKGKLAMDLGVFGAPETFVVDHNNVIRKRFAGILDKTVWQRQFLPLILKIEEEMAAESAAQ